MQNQPKAKPYRSSSFFRDGLSSRPFVEGTVPRGWLRTDTEFFTGKKRKPQSSTAAPAPGSQLGPATSTSAPEATSATPTAEVYPDDLDTFPFPITQKILTRGQERFQIFCSVCHGMTGYGDGMIVKRGFRRPPSYHDPRLRNAPVGHFFDVITNGWGAMPSYATQIPVQDRWAIIAYLRALQLSQQGAQPPAAPVSAPVMQSKPASRGQN